jgi:hypothetical protein
LPRRELNGQKFFASFFQEKRFFFSEEKKQKTFASWGLVKAERRS